MKNWVGQADILLLTLDTLRFDAAQSAFQAGELTTLGPHLGPGGWQQRHSPASFTYAAHQAFLAGFLPTPLGPGPHPRLFAAKFAGSLSTTSETFVFEEATLPQALAREGYHTICVGGTGFFNLQNELSRVIPNLFAEAVWRPELGVSDRNSPQNQVQQALASRQAAGKSWTFTLLNASALHQPNWFYWPESVAGQDSWHSHRAALVAFDRALAPLLQVERPLFVIACSDHGTAYGEDGYHGHRLGHPVVWTVPYAEFTVVPH